MEKLCSLVRGLGQIPHKCADRIRCVHDLIVKQPLN